MIRHPRLNRIAIVAAALLLFAAARSGAQSVIWPTSGSGGNYKIVVLSDGYAAGDEWKFTRAVNGLVLDRLMVNYFYNAQSDKFTIVKDFVPKVSSAPQYGITPNYDINRCYIDYNSAATLKAIDAAVGSLNPVRVIIIGNYEGVAFGCTSSDGWTYVSAGAREIDSVLEHEGGHLIGGLWDEFSLPNNLNYTGTVDGINCSNNYSGTTFNFRWLTSTCFQPTPPPPSTTNQEGCLLFQYKVYRPFDTCLMRSANTPFDCVCADAMTQTLAQYGLPNGSARGQLRAPGAERVLVRPVVFQPPAGPAAGTALRSVRLLVHIVKAKASDTTGATGSIVGLRELDAPIVHQYYRNGDIVYGIVDDTSGAVLESGVLTGDPFERRGFSGSSSPHQVDNSQLEATFVIMLPQMSRAELQSRKISITFVKLEPSAGVGPSGDRVRMNPDQVKKYLVPGATYLAKITASQLAQAALTPP
jgi:IgA Peptidase M64